MSKLFDGPEFYHSGIYYILNRLTNRIYVGETSGIWNRLAAHVNGLNRAAHHNKPLQHDWITCGAHVFEFGVLATTDNEIHRTAKARSQMRRKIELIFITMYRANDPRFGYNIANH